MTSLTSPVLDQLKALAQDTRYALIRHLAPGERCVCDLEALLNLPQSKVSYHLGILRDAGLVTAEQRGKNMYYALNRAALYRLGGDLLVDLLPDQTALTHQVKSVC